MPTVVELLLLKQQNNSSIAQSLNRFLSSSDETFFVHIIPAKHCCHSLEHEKYKQYHRMRKDIGGTFLNWFKDIGIPGAFRSPDVQTVNVKVQ